MAICCAGGESSVALLLTMSDEKWTGRHLPGQLGYGTRIYE